MSNLAEKRKLYVPLLPTGLQGSIAFQKGSPTAAIADVEKIQSLFPNTFGQPLLAVQTTGEGPVLPLRVGIVLSGGQAAGGHNVIAGAFDALGGKGELIGFLNGPQGIIDGKFISLDKQKVAAYRNQGGFDIIGSGRTKIETGEQKQAALKALQDLDGLIIVGGDDSNTNAAVLAEYAVTHGVKTRIVGVPKTIDGDLKNVHIPISFGFDTATKTYSEMIGNIGKDALSAKKYTHFIKLMGRSASHIALECALRTHPNHTFIGEEVAYKQWTLQDLVRQVADLVDTRAKMGKNFGLILIPEGIIEFIPEMGALIGALNTLLAQGKTEGDLSPELCKIFQTLPEKIQQQLLLDRDPHGNVQVAHIGTEELFIALTVKELKARNSPAKFSPVPHFFGYEGRSALPSNFDANYCNALGHLAIHLIRAGYTGYMATLQNLTRPPTKWTAQGVPITSLLCLEMRKGKEKPVIHKALVDLKGRPFKTLAAKRDSWALKDDYQCPGPIQFFGESDLTDTYPLSL